MVQMTETKMGEAGDFDSWVNAAREGDANALERLVLGVQDRVAHLARRMLVDPEDARDATQEILVKVVTQLSQYEGRSPFSTWVYRVATNYLLNAKKVQERERGYNFEMFATDLEDGLEANAKPVAERNVLYNELRIACSMAMLLCLDPPHRIAYVLGDILDFDQGEAAEVLGIQKDNFRKRLSRARSEVVAFTSRRCGLVNRSAACRCERRLPIALKLGRVREGQLNFTGEDAPDYDSAVEMAENAVGAIKTLKLQRATGRFDSPVDFGKEVMRIVGEL